MKNPFLGATAMAASLAATNIAVAQCDKNFQEVTVTGTVDTLVVSQFVQAGTIDLQLESVKTNKVLFDERGAVVGQITNVDPTNFPIIVTLDHDITFDDRVKIETTGDQATVWGDPNSQLYVPVVETLSNFSGTKNFRKATGEIRATGFLNVPKFDGLHNEFELSGSLCIKD